MADPTHQFETTVEWTAARLGTLQAQGRPPILAGAPPEYGGTDDVWSPEHLCVGAVNTCIMLTFLTIAANSKVAVQAFTSHATGTVEKTEGRTAITRIVVHPRITVGTDVERAKVDRLIAMAERNCFISNSLKSTVTIEAEVIVQ